MRKKTGMLTDARLKSSQTKLKLLSLALTAGGVVATTFCPSSLSVINDASAFKSNDDCGARLTRL